MNRSIRVALTGMAALALCACGGGGGGAASTTPTPPKYAASAAFDFENSAATSLSAVLTKIGGQAPVTTDASCVDDPATESPAQFTYVTIWAGSYPDASLSGATTDIQRVALMTERQQVAYMTTAQFNIGAAALAGVADSSLEVPLGTTSLWYEFYCKSGTLSAGKVTL